MREKWIVYGWEYANANTECPFAIAEFWVEQVFSSEERASRYVGRLKAAHADSPFGDIHYDYSGPFDEDAESL